MIPLALKSIDFGQRTEVVVRVNGVLSGLMAGDVEGTVKGTVIPDGLMLPKVEDETHLKAVSDMTRVVVIV